jgi:hypothetical protein
MQYVFATMPMRSAVAAIWISAMLVRCVLAFGFHRQDTARGEVQNIALTLAFSGRFADPYRIPTGPTAHTGPVYPAVNALIYRMAGDTPLADRLREVLNMGFAATLYAMLPLLGLRLGLGPRAGRAAGFCGALLPIYYWGELPGAFENGLSALLLAAATLWIAPHIVKAEPVSAGKAWFLGGWAAFLILTSPTLLPPLLALACLAVWRAAPPAGILLRASAAFLVVLAPWTIRNAVEFHRLIPVRSDFGIELAVSNNSEASPDADANTRTRYVRAHHPFDGLRPALAVKAEGEAAYSAQMLREGLAWISGHPLDFARLSGERMAEFWFPASHYLWHATGVTLVAVLALAGWVVAWSNARPAAWILMAVPLSYSLTFLLIEACIRYTYPIAWSLLLAAGALTASRRGTGEGRYLVR